MIVKREFLEEKNRQLRLKLSFQTGFNLAERVLYSSISSGLNDVINLAVVKECNEVSFDDETIELIENIIKR